MSEVATVLQLHDLDLLLNEALDPKSRARLKKLGFEVQDPVVLQRARARLLQGVDRRWVNHYERALKRSGWRVAGPEVVAVVRDRVCQGCFITLPTSASPNAEESLTVCESCGRILYWR